MSGKGKAAPAARDGTKRDARARKEGGRIGTGEMGARVGGKREKGVGGIAGAEAMLTSEAVQGKGVRGGGQRQEAQVGEGEVAGCSPQVFVDARACFSVCASFR